MTHGACPVEAHIPKSGDQHQNVFRCQLRFCIQGFFLCVFVGTIEGKNTNFSMLYF